MAKKSKTEAVQVTATIAMESGEGTPVYYVNHVEISHTKNDFCITAGRLPARFGPTAKTELESTGVLLINAEVQILFPPTMLPGLIRALSSQQDAYEKRVKYKITDTSDKPEADRPS